LNDGILIECTEWLAPRTAEPITTDTMPSTASRQTQLMPRPEPYAGRNETAGLVYVRLDDVGGGEVEVATGVEVTEFVGPEPCGAPAGCVGASAPSPSSGRLTGLLWYVPPSFSAANGSSSSLRRPNMAATLSRGRCCDSL
jgi:hypothetical protein